MRDEIKYKINLKKHKIYIKKIKRMRTKPKIIQTRVYNRIFKSFARISGLMRE
jgi:hypothetical protein